MAQNINSMLGGMPDDIEKGGMVIYIINIKTFFNINKTLNLTKCSAQYVQGILTI